MRNFFQYRWLVVMSLSFAISSVNFADRGVLGVVAPKLIDDFHLSPGDIGIISSAFGFGYAAVQVLAAGEIIRRLRPRSAIVIFATLWSVFLTLTTVATSAVTLFIYRLLFGFTEGPNWPAMETVISRWFPARETQRAFNFSWAGIPVGSIWGPPLAVALVAAFDWRAPFFVLAGIGVLVVLLFFVFVTDDPATNRFVGKAEREMIIADRISQTAITADAKPPKVYQWRDLLRTKSLWLATASSWSTSYVVYLLLAFFPLYLTSVRHVHYESIGWLVALPYIAALLGGLSMGYAADKFFLRGWRYASRVAIPGALGIVAGALILGAVLITSLPVSLTFFAVSAFCLQASNGVVNATAIDICPEEPHLATQMIVGGGSCASVMAPLISGALVSAAGSYLPAFLLAGSFAVIAGIAVLIWFRPRALAITSATVAADTAGDPLPTPRAR